MNAKPIIHVGIALILLGVVAFTYQGGGDTSDEKTVDTRSLQAAIDTKQTLTISPVLGRISACRWDRVGSSWRQKVVLVPTYHALLLRRLSMHNGGTSCR